MIPYGRQTVDDADVAEVVEVLRGDWLTQGPAVKRFEDELAGVTGAAHAVAFSSGTAALHGAAWAGGLRAGDTVATSPLSFAASAACARYVGAEPRFVDIDAATLNMDVSQLPSCDALVAVHYAGLPIDLTQLRSRPRVVIEDAAHALGAITPTGPVGNCAQSDMTVFSFHPVKAVTSAEGGAVTTNSDELADALRRFRSHGMSRRAGAEGWWYEITHEGFNYRLSDVHAALGASQLRKLDSFIQRRNELAERYDELLSDFPVTLPPRTGDGWRHAYHLYAIRVDDRNRVYRSLHDRGIRVQVHYIPIYRHPWYAPFGDPTDFPATEHAAGTLLSLPMYPALSDAEQDDVVRALGEALESP